MTLTPGTLIEFAGDGDPDTYWLSIHERSSRTRGETLQADALAWMITEFDRFVVTIPDADEVVDPDIDFPRLRTRVGQYRLFEFTVALEERRLARAVVAQELAVTDIAAGMDAHREPRSSPTYEVAAKEEIRACRDNFLCTVAYSDEFGVEDSSRSRWINTVPADVPGELRDFAAAYLDTMRSASTVRDRDEALRQYSADLRRTLDCPSDRLGDAAGRAHARYVVLFEIGAARTRSRNAAREG